MYLIILQEGRREENKNQKHPNCTLFKMFQKLEKKSVKIIRSQCYQMFWDSDIKQNLYKWTFNSYILHILLYFFSIRVT